MEWKTNPVGVSKMKTTAASEARHLFSSFCGETTAHGFGQLARERGTVQRLIWSLLVIASFVTTIFFMSQLFGTFLEYNTEEVTDISYSSGGLELPSVTVCNINPISPSKSNYMTEKQQEYVDILTMLSYLQNATAMGKVDFVNNHIFRLMSPIGLYEHDLEAPEQAGQTFTDFVIKCRIYGETCKGEYFSKVVDSQYYNCYMFNGFEVPKNQTISLATTGPQNGLSLILYLESDNGHTNEIGVYDQNSNVFNGAGARVVIHPPRTFPSPLDSGFDVPPGFSTSVGINAKRRQLLGGDYEKCSNDKYTSETNHEYSRDECLKMCNQRLVIERCGCKTPYLPTSPSASNISYCGYLHKQNFNVTIENMMCEAAVLHEFSNTDLYLTCYCLSPCSETSYNTFISQSYWPLEHFAYNFIVTHIYNHPESTNLKAYQVFKDPATINDIGGLVRKNFLRLNVYFESLNTDIRRQREAYDGAALFSDIGGTLGLWIGCSMLTVCEFLQLVWYCLMICFKRLVKDNKVKTIQIQPRAPSVTFLQAPEYSVDYNEY